MTAAAIEDWQVTAPADSPHDVVAFAPPDIESVAQVLRWASQERRPVLPWGGGTHLGPDTGAAPGVIVMTARLNDVVDWQPDDLTLVVGAGMRVDEVEAMLAERGQSAILPEQVSGATVGGVIAAGVSGYRRLRYGPTRDRLLETVVATGDGRVARSGARVVKNVTGYDIPRLMCGSLGSLGVIGQVCLKLWPLAGAAATLQVDVAAFQRLYRPLALLETELGASAYIAGTPEEVAAQAEAVGVTPGPGLSWPPALTHDSRIEMRVPSPLVTAAVKQVRESGAVGFRAQHSVGIVEAGFEDWSAERLRALRDWAEAHDGAAVVLAASVPDVDRWGTPPDSIAIQHRVKEAFDPRGVMVPGRLPGGI